MAKYKHLTIDERHDIEQCLNKQKSFKEIGRMLNRDPTTISKEVVGHIKIRNAGGKSRAFNVCKKRNVCKKVQSVCKPCHHPYARGLFCTRCGECNSTCSEFEEERCPKLRLPPYVCNGCKRITRCRLQKQYYYGDFAQREYEAVRSESRQGIATAPEELRWIDAVISPLIKQGQSIHHICSTHADEIMLNEKTIYNYNDLPRKVRYRRRQKKN